MPKALLIAEKKSLRDDIEKAYNRCRGSVAYDIDFTNQQGHLVELLEPIEINPIYKSWDISLLPIDPAKEGGWKYKVSPKTKNMYKEIESAVKSGKYDYIIHAGDPDQEGELLVNLVLNKIGNKLPVLRFWSNDTTTDALEYALQHLESDEEPKYKRLLAAGLLRMHEDWLFGFNGSRAVADRIAVGRTEKIAIGRVMTWAQCAIVDREDEITNFVPKTTYGVKITCDNELEGNLYKEVTHIVDKEDTDDDKDESVGLIYFDSKSEAEAVITDINSSVKVSSVNKVRTTTYAPKLYQLATVQVDAAKLGYSAARTLEIIQELYEAHYLSYPRTDCEVMSSNENFRAIIASASCVKEFEDAANYALTQITKITGMSKYVNDKELAKHGHSALVPTTVRPNFASLSPDQQVIYKMIAKRFLAIFQPPLLQDKITAILTDDKYTFKASGKTVVDAGYTDFLGVSVKEVNIPNINQDDILSVKAKDITEKTTKCPERFTEGTLIRAMLNPAKYLHDKTIKNDVKDLKIGTSATRAEIIKKLIKDKYIELEKNYLKPTDFGAFMAHTIRGVSLCNADTTGQLEQMLQKVRTGEVDADVARNDMYDKLNELLSMIKAVNKVSYGNATERIAIMQCPGCGKDIMESAKNYFCTGYKGGCKYSIIKEFVGAKIEKEDAIKLFNGEEIEKILKKKDLSTGQTKSWTQKLRFNPNEGKFQFVEATEEITSYQCPGCHENLYQKGKKISCHTCDFSLWTSVANKDLSEDNLSQLFTSGKTKLIKGFKGKKGPFDAYLKLKNTGTEYKLDFVFPEK